MQLAKSSGSGGVAVCGRSCWPVGRLVGWVALSVGMAVGQVTLATDYFVTIGGGYTPAQNQASLEANVQFFQDLLRERHRGARTHDIFFADGDDGEADLQVAVTEPGPELAATKLLATLHRQDGQQVEYRNHQVADIAGANEPERVRASLERIGQRARAGDRLMLYVTAHGGRAEDDDPYNTTITCWDDQSITMRQLTAWLDKLPDDLPVILVMAQCYCGGFSHTIFADGDDEGPLARPLRIGFFAQQHNLAAAGCRPDIENDEEFSSYFWGAMAGRSRTGKPIEGCDLDRDGKVSFLEAYAYSVTNSTTIDIPLRATDVLLRTYSQIGEASEEEEPADDGDDRTVGDHRDEPDGDDEQGDQDEHDSPSEGDEVDDQTPRVEAATLARLEGRLDALVAGQTPAVRVMVGRLSQELGVAMSSDVSEVRDAYRAQRDQTRQLRRGSRRRGRSGRRDVLAEIAQRWPELADRDHWRESPLLEPARQAELVADIQQLPSYAAYDERAQRRKDVDRQSEESERREVKFRRLLQTLESIVLARNLPQVADPDVVRRYEEMLRLENSTLVR